MAESDRHKVRDRYVWKAWDDAGTLHVAGVYQAGSPGFAATLTKAVPQGFNPRILILDFKDRELPGAWPDVVTHTPATFEGPMPPESTYTHVTIRFPRGGDLTLTVIRGR